MEENDGEEVEVKTRSKKGKIKFLIDTPKNIPSRPRYYIQPVKPRTSYRIERVVSLAIYNKRPAYKPPQYLNPPNIIPQRKYIIKNGKNSSFIFININHYHYHYHYHC